MQDCISYKPTISSMWFDAPSVFGHLFILTFLTVLIVHDDVLTVIRESLLKIMDLEQNPEFLRHTHENELNTAYLELYIPSNSSEKYRYALLGQSRECQNCQLQSILDHVKNGSTVKLDTRYGGQYNLSLLRQGESR